MRGICVGLGNRGRSWYRWAQKAGMDVVAVVDMNRGILDASAEQLGIPESMRFESIAEAVQATGANVATVCAANPAHTLCLHQCLDAGVHVLIEKPMVETLEDAKAVMRKAETAGLRVAVSQNYRYQTGVLTARDAVQNRRIGDIVSVSVDFYRWRPTKGLYLPLMMNQSIHHFDAIRWILGQDPEWCFARSFNPSWNDCDGPTVLEVLYGFEGEVVVTYSGSYVAQGDTTPYSGRWRIEGSTGQIQFGGDGSEPPLLSRRETSERLELPLVKSDLDGPAQVCWEFLQALRNDEMPLTDSTDNIKSLAMGWAAQLSSDEQRPVQFADLLC